MTLPVVSPSRPAMIFGKIRRMRTRGFPFFIYYVVDESRIVVLAVFHARRNPTIWRDRK